MKKWMEWNVPRRLLSLALSAAMVLSLLPVSAFAEENDGPCAHHTKHTADCGYVAAVAGQDCGHVHGEACGYAEASDCTHSHDDTCGYREASPCTHQHTGECGEDGSSCTHAHDETCGYAEARDCTHSHDDTCGYRASSPCIHEHNETCGYVEAVAGQPCAYHCEVCASEKEIAQVQALIDALPEDVTAETKEAAQAALSAVDTAKSSLTAEEQALLDMTRYTALTGKLAALEAPAPDTTEETTEKTDKVITGWAWVDPDKWLDETGSFAMPGVTEDSPAYFDDVVEYLPTQITADGGEVLTLGDWVCDTYPMETGTSQGAYVFETTLPAGYILSDGSNVLRVNVTIAPVDLTEGPEAAVYATNITYLDSAGHTQTCSSATVVTDSVTAWSNGWYVAQASDTPLTISSRVAVNGEVHLILANGCNLTVSGGIGVNSGNSLTIYAQSTGENMGRLTAQNVNNLYAGIGGDDNCSGGTIIINGGTVTATGGERAAGIGGGSQGSGGTITINGGNVYANGAYGGVGIGGGYGGSGGTITINGGNVTATGGTNAAGIGGSNSDSGGEIAISGNAIVNATGGELAAGIGGSCASAGGNITISGGTVTATGGSSAAGIGGGSQSSGGNITISGGTVTATGSSYGAGIGGGGSNWTNGGSGGIITISGGTVTANGGNNGGAGIGGGQGESTSGGSGSFSTGTNGSAVIYASSISDMSQKGSWGGIIFEGDNGTVYGDQILTEDLTIEAEKALTVPAGAKLTIPEGVTLTSNGTITNNGTIIKNGTINGTITGNQPPVSVKYLDASGTETTCASATVVTDSDTAWSDGWYVAQGNVTIDSRITVSGEVHLILEDGCDLTVSGGIGVNEGNSLTIYAQSTVENMGMLTATGGEGAGIGGDDSSSDGNAGSITINGGNITATSSYGAGIGGGMSGYTGGSGGNITINGGTVTATSGEGAGIGGGYGEDGGSGGKITINGGTVTATSSGKSAGIGGGHGVSGGSGGTIIISGGTVTATGGEGAGIGDSKNGSGGSFSTGTNGSAVIYASSISDTSQKGSWGGSVYFPLNLTYCTATGGVSTYPGKLYGLYGSTITLTAQPTEGKAFTRWQPDDETILLNGNSFTMPTNAVSVTAQFSDIVASVRVGETVTNYASLKDAFAAASGAEGSTLTLLRDEVIADKTLIASGRFTLDLNGNTLTSSATEEAISVNGSLTITDSSETKSGVIQNNTNNHVICNYGSLTIEGGAIRATNCINNSGTLVMNNGTLETNSSDTGLCIFNVVGHAVTITGGTLKKQAGSNIFRWLEGITLQGGSFPDGISVLENGSVRSLLKEGYAFYDLDAYTNQAGTQTLVSVDNTQMGIQTSVVVLPHTHSFTSTKKDDDLHTAACECGYSETVNHDFEGNNGFCKQCDAYQPAEWVPDPSDTEKYNISNAGQLFWFADYVNKNAEPEARSAWGLLQNDITIPKKADGSDRVWTPIGTDAIPYVGEFYGNGYTVSGLYITNQEDYSSFFGVVSGKILNLTIAEDSQIDAPDHPHGVAAGICGRLTGGEIRNCTNRAAISCTGDMQSAAGICVDNNGRISGCTNAGKISGQGSASGICANNQGTIENCTNSGEIDSGAIAGGICGMNFSTIENCANSGMIQSQSNAGGICGRNDGTVSYCYSIGTSIIKINNSQQVNNCYYLADREMDELDGTTAMTEAQFRSGEVAYLLNVNPSADEVVWGQQIGTESYPVLGGKQVYRLNSCPIYSNSEEESGNAHTPGENGTCEHCGVALEATVRIAEEGSSAFYGYVSLADAFAAADGKKATITLLRDANIGPETLTISGGEVTLQSAEKSDPAAEGPTSYTITANWEHSSNAVTGIAVTGGTFNFDSGILQVSSGLDGIRVTDGTLNFRDGTIKHYAGMSIRIMEGVANISGGTIQGVCADYGTLNISAGFIEDLCVVYAQTALSGGSFGSIYHTTDTVSKLLADGYAYYLEGKWVDATNGSNGETLASSPEAIQVLPIPVKIETQPTDTTLTYGEDKSLSVTAVAAEGKTVNYQWFDGSEPIADATDSSLPLSGLGVGSYQIFCRLTCDGYILNSATVNVTVNKATNGWTTDPTITGWTYGGTPSTPVGAARFGTVTVKYKANDADDNTYSTTVPTTAGDYKARFTVEGTDNYGGLSEVKDFTISPKAITATITPNGGTYGKTITAATAVLNGVVSGDTVPVTLTYTGTANDGTDYNSTATPSKAGSYTVTATISNSNYTMAASTAAFVIQKLTVKTPDDVSTTYNGQTQTSGIPETDYYNADTTSGKDADTYDVQLALKDTANCQWDERGGKLTFTIEKATNEWRYPPRTTAWTYGDSPDIDAGRPKAGTTEIEYSTDGGQTYSKTVPTDAGTYKVRFTAKDKNYLDLVAVKDIIINKRHLTITWGSTTSFPYDGENHQPTAEAGNVVSGDSITLVVSGAQKNVGDHTATVTGFTAGEGTKAGNYSLPSANLNTPFSIQAKALTVNVRVADKQYDGQNSATFDGTPTLDGVIEADQGKVTLNNGTPTFKSEDVGNDIEIVFTTGFSISGTASGNYTLTQPAAVTASITAKPISDSDITVTLDQISFVYDGTEKSPQVTVKFGTATLVEDTDYTLSGNTATNADTYTLTVTGKGNYTGTTTKDWKITRASITPVVTIANTVYGGTLNPSVSGNPGSGDVTYTYYSDAACTTEVNPKDVDTYYVKATVAQTDNYQSGTSQAVSFGITKAPLTVTAKDHAITYGEAPGNNGVTYDGFVNGEKEGVLGGTLTYTYSYSQYGDVGSSYTITPAGLTSGNYQINFVNGTLKVEQLEIGIAWDNTQLTYNGSEQKPAAAPTGLVNNDDITLTVSGAQTNAGSGYTATVTAIEGDKAGNYALPQSVTAPFSIAKAASSVTTAPTDARSLFTGGNVPLIKAGDAEGGTMQYRLGEEGQWSDTVPQAVEYGEYTVYYYVKGDGNHEDSTEQSIKARILPFRIPSQPQPQDINYGTSTELSVGLETKVTEGISYQWCLVTVEETGEVYTPLENETGSNLILTKLNAGTYVYACVVTCGDYSETSSNVPVTVTAVPQDLPPTSDLPEGLWVEGGEEPLNGNSIDLKSPSSFLLTSYTYNGASDDVHQNYPTGMQVYSVGIDEQGVKTVTPVADLGNLLQYSGCSIRITGKPGIRMITSLTKEAKEALKKGALADYTLEEYGTVVAWKDTLGDNPLTLSTGKSNYAYRKGVSDPVFANVGDLTQYTNVLVWDELEDAKYAEDIVMRPYIILSKGGETVTLYGGTVSRSIGYVAQQNANTFPKGSAGYNYVHEIIDKVNALNSSTGTNTTTGGNG